MKEKAINEERRVCTLARISDRYDGSIDKPQYRFVVLAEQHVSQLKHLNQSSFTILLVSCGVFNRYKHCLVLQRQNELNDFQELLVQSVRMRSHKWNSVSYNNFRNYMWLFFVH